MKKNLKRLETIEKRLNEIYLAEALEQEYIQWVEEHPIGDVRTDPSFNFYQWIDSIPTHLAPCFQKSLKKAFNRSRELV